VRARLSMAAATERPTALQPITVVVPLAMSSVVCSFQRMRRYSAPWSLTIMAAVVVIVAISLAMHGLGAGQSDGWLIVAAGAINPTVNVTDRWWTARAGTAG